MSKRTIGKNLRTVKFTRWVATGPITKSMKLNEDGMVEKSTTAQSLYEGDVETVECTISDFAHNILGNTSNNQCISFGTPVSKAAVKLTTKARLNEELTSQGYIARDNDHMSWPSGPGLLMIDYDPSANETLTQDELLRRLYELCPQLIETAHVWSASSSSNIFNRETGAELAGIRGQRVYIAVQNGRDIERAAEALGKRAWLAGYGCIQISKAGQILLRNKVFDTCVFQPSRIDFCAAPVCEAPLESHRPKPVILGDENVFLDSIDAIPDLLANEQLEYKKLVLSAKVSAASDALKAKADYKARRLQEYSDRTGEDGAPYAAAIDSAVNHQTLVRDFELYSEFGEVVTVGEVLDNPGKWGGQRFADPLEPDYNNDKRIAKVYLSGPTPTLYSYAHGGARFALCRQRFAVDLVEGERNTAMNAIADYLGSQLLAVRCRDVSYRVSPSGVLEKLTPEKVVALIDEHIRIVVPSINSSKPQGRPRNCTQEIAKLFLHNYSSRLPHVDAAVTSPILSPNSGRILEQNGYYSDERCLITIPEKLLFRPILEPTIEDIEAALRRLWAPFRLYPYVAPIDQTVVLSAILTAVVRPLLPTSPAFGIDAPVQGAGKTGLAKAIMAMCDGVCETFPPFVDSREEETRKKLLSIFAERKAAVLIDNIDGEFNSPSLAACLTSETYTDRELGHSRSINVIPRALVLLTGNNLAVKGDLPRRVLVSRIDPQCESAHLREFDFDPAEFVRTNRLSLAADAMTLLRSIHVFPQKNRLGKGRLASFEVWDDAIRQVVCLLADFQEKGFFENSDDLPLLTDPSLAINHSIEEDPELLKLKRLLLAVEAKYGFNSPMTINEMERDCPSHLALHSEVDIECLDLLNALVDAGGDPKLHRVNARSLGKWMAKHSDRIVDGLCLRKGRSKNGTSTWLVERI